MRGRSRDNLTSGAKSTAGRLVREQATPALRRRRAHHAFCTNAPRPPPDLLPQVPNCPTAHTRRRSNPPPPSWAIFRRVTLPPPRPAVCLVMRALGSLHAHRDTAIARWIASNTNACGRNLFRVLASRNRSGRRRERPPTELAPAALCARAGGQQRSVREGCATRTLHHGAQGDACRIVGVVACGNAHEAVCAAHRAGSQSRGARAVTGRPATGARTRPRPPTSGTTHTDPARS